MADINLTQAEADALRSRVDTKEVRSADLRVSALWNGPEQPESSAVIDAPRSYDVRPVEWSARESRREELAA